MLDTRNLQRWSSFKLGYHWRNASSWRGISYSGLSAGQRQDVKYVNHLSPIHDYGMFNNRIKPYAAD